MSEQVTIENIGPIERVVFDMDDDGGILVVSGRNGAGKTTVRAVISSLLGSNGSADGLTPRDGSPNGEAVGFGRRLRINKRASVTGALSVPSIGNKLDIGKLVDPGVADKKLRTKHRIRALVSLCANAVDPQSLVPEELRSYVDLDSASEFDDPVLMADFLKRQLDSAALDAEKTSDVKSQLAKARRTEAGDIDELGKIDLSEVAAEFDRTSEELSKAKVFNESRKRTIENNARVRKQLETISINHKGPSIKAADAAVAVQATLIDTIKSQIADLQQQLREAEAEQQRRESVAKEARAHSEELKRLSGMLTTDIAKEIDVAPLEEKRNKIRETMLQAETLRNRKAALDESRVLQDAAVEYGNRAEMLRNAAKEAAAKIQQFLPEGPIKLVDGQLVVDYKPRKKLVPYDELSDGERWIVALQYAIDAVGQGGVIPVSQEAWQGLDTKHRKIALKKCKENKVWLLAGEKSDTPLQVDQLQIDGETVQPAEMEMAKPF